MSYTTARFFLLVCAASIGIVLIATVEAHGHMKKMTCLGKDFDTKHCFQGWMECAGEILGAEDVKAFKDPNTPLEKKKEIGKKAHANTCIRVCQWKKHQHLITEDGKLNETARNEMVDHLYPDEARAGIKAGFEKCFQDNSKAFNDENNCAGYQGFEGCLFKSHMEVCKVNFTMPDPMEE